MNKVVADKWIEALRSGKYAQTRGTLCRSICESTSHCCLGVLTEIAIEHGLKVEKTRYEKDKNIVVYNGNAAFLPMNVQAWAEIKNVDGMMFGGEGIEADIEIGGKKYASLAQANDDGKTFDEIADVLEANWDKF